MSDIVAGFEETSEDLAYQPVAGCCVDCDEALEFAAWEHEMAGKSS